MMLIAGYYMKRIGKRLLMLIAIVSGMCFYASVLMATTPAVELELQILNAIFLGILCGIGMLYFQDLMPEKIGSATTLYANTSRVIVKNCDDIWLCSMMYCAQTPELPHNTAAIRTFSIPFLVEPIFPSAYCFVVYVCRHDSKNGEDGSVCATPIFLSPDW
jgi:hypothetical protein